MALSLGGGLDTRSGRIAALQQYLAAMGRGGGLQIPSRPLSGGPGSASGAPSGEGVSGSSTGTSGSGFSGLGPTNSPGAITGPDANLAALGFSALGSVTPGVANVASVLGAGLGKAAGLAGVGSNLSMATENGPVSIANLSNNQGVMGALMNGQLPTLTNLANTFTPTLSAMFQGPQFAAVGPNGELSMVSNATAMQDAQAGRTALGGQVGSFGPQGGFDSIAQNEGVLSGQLNAYTGQPMGPRATDTGPATAAPPPPSNDPTNNPAVNADDSGASGSAGDSHICGALYRRGLLTREDLAANELYRRRMSPEAYRGYSRWALPLVRFADTHPTAGRLLTATLGRLALLYMREIRTPGSSRSGRLLLRVGLPICRWLGARTISAMAR